MRKNSEVEYYKKNPGYISDIDEMTNKLVAEFKRKLFNKECLVEGINNTKTIFIVITYQGSSDPGTIKSNYIPRMSILEAIVNDFITSLDCFISTGKVLDKGITKGDSSLSFMNKFYSVDDGGNNKNVFGWFFLEITYIVPNEAELVFTK